MTIGDELITLKNSREKMRRCLDAMFLFVMSITVAAIILVHLIPMFICVFVAAYAILVPVALFLRKKSWCVSTRIRAIAEEVKHNTSCDQLELVHELYGHGIDALIALVECQEAHINGECPICAEETANDSP